MKKVIEYIKKNWLPLVFGILIGWIIISDVLDQFVWKTGMMFRPNSMYMSFVYIVIFMVVPFIVIENVFKDKYKDIELEEYKDKCESPKDVGRIIVSGVGKLALIIGSVFGMFWLVGTMQEIMLESVIDTSKPYIFISNFSDLPLATGIGMFVLFVWMFSKKGIVSRDLSDDGKTDFFAAGERARLPWKVKCGIAGCALIVFVLSIGSTMLSYDCVTEEGVIYKCLWIEKDYAWDDVKEVAERTVERGVITVVLEMKDGHKVVLGDAAIESGVESLEHKWKK
ncbi:MAG: hypothetical protein IJE49_02340 [Agathobacter sp.]|nr:hypothetical protein [Agathobacter sp.]